MKRLIIIAEGQTEEEFINKSLMPYFLGKGIYAVSAIKIQTSRGHKGGFVHYSHLRNDLIQKLSESNVIVSTLVDFFKIPTSVPSYQEMSKFSNIDDKIDLLLKGMRDDINNRRFVPYIQKHEFEALLFSSNIGFEEMYDNPKIFQATKSIIDKYDNPEDINNHPNTAPSKRVTKIIAENGEKYNKVVDGNLIAETIGIEIIIEKCPRFKNWLDVLVSKLKED